MNLTKEEWNELRRLVKKVQTNTFIKFDSQDTDSLTKKVKFLSFSEKAELLNLSLTAVGVSIYDAGELFNTKIRIDDFSSLEREKRPYAHIIHQNYANPSENLVETIDIFDSLRKNATSIGHPAIIFAISRWEKIALAANIIKQGNVYHRDETECEIDDLFYGSRVDNAERYLKEIGETLLMGIKNRAASTKRALFSEIERLGLNEKNTYLYIAWECLEKKWMLHHCPGDYEANKRLEAIRQHLDQPLSDFGYDKIQDSWIYKPKITNYNARAVFNDTIKLETVIDFLKEDGRKFVEPKVSNHRYYDVNRPRFKVFSRAFGAWYLQKATSTISDYLEDGKKEPIIKTEYSDIYSFNSPRQKNVFQIIGEVFINPPSKVREPVTISDTDTHSIERTINQMGIK